MEQKGAPANEIPLKISAACRRKIRFAPIFRALCKDI
jgi:hypothetical protein